jgi:hypothetical protein
MRCWLTDRGEGGEEGALRAGIGNRQAAGVADAVPGVLRASAFQDQDDCGQRGGPADAVTAVHGNMSAVAQMLVQYPAQVERGGAVSGVPVGRRQPEGLGPPSQGSQYIRNVHPLNVLCRLPQRAAAYPELDPRLCARDARRF